MPDDIELVSENDEEVKSAAKSTASNKDVPKLNENLTEDKTVELKQSPLPDEGQELQQVLNEADALK